MDALEKEFAFKSENLALASGLERADNGLKNIAAAFVIDEFDKLDAGSKEKRRKE